ncbi:MAG: exosortase/archaeosortase family protein [Marinobacter sp.]
MLRKTLAQFPLARPYLVVVLVSIALFFPTWFRLAQEWIQFEQVLAHGLPTFLIFIGLLLIHPPKPAKQKASNISWLGGVTLLSSVIIWGLLELVRIDTLSYLMLPVGLLAVCWTLLGLSAAVRLLPYVLLFGLSLPVWADIVPFLVALATIVVGKAVSLMGITALIEGANITLPYGRLVIADGCSGIRYFAVSILVATITAILNDYRWKGWLVALTIGAGLALIVNWVRIAALVVIAYQSNMESELVSNHETFGWVVYAGFLIPVMLLAPAHRRVAAVDWMPPKMTIKPYVFVVLALLIGPIGITLAHSAASDASPWRPAAGELRPTEPADLPLAVNVPSFMTHQVWTTSDGNWLSLAQSTRTAANEKLVPYLPSPIDTSNWFLASEHLQGRIRIYQNLTSRRKVAVYQRFLVGSYRTGSYRVAKLLQIPATLTGQGRFALLTLQTSCDARECDNAIQRLSQQIEDRLVTLGAQGTKRDI